MEATFRTAPVRRARTFRLEDGQLALLTRGGGVEWRLDLATVERAQFVDFGKAKAPSRRLDLFAGGTRRRVAINATAGLGTMADDMAAFLDLCTATCLALGEARPDLKIGLGEYGAARWAMFGMGAVSVVGGAGILATALAGGLPASRLIEAAVPLGLLMVVGGFIAWGNRPGAAGAQLSPDALATALRTLRNR